MSQKKINSKQKKTAIVFLGPPEVALPSLQALHAAHYDIKLVVTQPDRPAGRGKRLTSPPVKVAAIKYGLRLAQPVNLRGSDFEQQLAACAAQIFIVVAYGRIIPEKLLQLPSFGVVNIHPSLLPQLRGPSPLQTAIARRFQRTGVTLMLLDSGLDSGPVLAQESVKIMPQETAGSLHDRLAKVGAELLCRTIPGYLAGTVVAKPQDSALATFTKKIDKADGRIDWTRDSLKVDALIRSLSPWPGAFTFWNKKRLKCLATRALKGRQWRQKDIGRTVLTKKSEIAVLCGRGMVVLDKIQLENKSVREAADFIKGVRNFIGIQLL